MHLGLHRPHDPTPRHTIHPKHTDIPLPSNSKLLLPAPRTPPHNPPRLARRMPPLPDLLQQPPLEIQHPALLPRLQIPQPHAPLPLAHTNHDPIARMHRKVIHPARLPAQRSGVAARPAVGDRDGALETVQQRPVAGAGDCDGGVFRRGEQLGAVGEDEAGEVGAVVQEGAELAVLWVFADGAGREGREEFLVGFVCDGAGGGRVRREVVDVDALVGAARGEEDLLGLARGRVRGRGEGEAADGRVVRVEEEGVGEVGFGLFRRGGVFCCFLVLRSSRSSGRRRMVDGRREAVEDAVVGPRDDLDGHRPVVGELEDRGRRRLGRLGRGLGLCLLCRGLGPCAVALGGGFSFPFGHGELLLVVDTRGVVEGVNRQATQ